MSEIDRLMAEHCPDGVEFVRLGDLLDYEQPGKYLVSSTAYDDSFQTPVLTAGKTFILGRTNESTGIYTASQDDPVIIFDDFTTAFKWVDFSFKAKSSAMKMLTSKSSSLTDLRFLYYAMQAVRYKPQDHARQWIGIYSDFRVPFPPPVVRARIVQILDTMTGLQAELQTELQTELQARTRQYEHHRDRLLTFADDASVKWAPMGEAGTFFRGRRFTKNDMVDSGLEAIHYGEIYTDYGVAAKTAISHVREDLHGQLRFAEHGDVIIAGVGETVGDVGKAVAWLGDGDVAIHDDTFAFRHDMNPKFVSYYLQTAAFHAQKEKHVSRAKVKRLSKSGLEQISMPTPPRDEQDRVVEILDRFDSLVADISTGLPAEIEARRKQYAYYRDKLLTFEEKVS